MRDLIIEGEIVIFKPLAISKTVHLAYYTAKQLNIINKNFIWQIEKPKIKQSTLCSSYENDSLKDVDIFYKRISLQYSWIRRSFHNSFHDWKVIPLFLIKKKFGEKF